MWIVDGGLLRLFSNQHSTINNLLKADENTTSRLASLSGSGFLDEPRGPSYEKCPFQQGHSCTLKTYALIFTKTPAGTTRRLSASMVRAVGSKMSITRLCVRISNCSRDFLSMCGDRSTVYRSIRVGTGMGPQTRALVRLACSTISRAEASRARWSYASIRILIRSPVIDSTLLTPPVSQTGGRWSCPAVKRGGEKIAKQS